MAANGEKNRDWVDVGLKAAMPLIVGLVVAYMGFFGDETLTRIANKQESARLITELQIRREQAESALRKDIFAQTLDAFLLKGKASSDGEIRDLSLREMSKQLLRLELLALNFGDSLSLSPLFTEMRRDLENAMPLEDEKRNFETKQENLQRRLNSLAKRVASAQLSSLLNRGREKSVRIPLERYSAQLADGLDCKVLLFDSITYSWPQNEILQQYGIDETEYAQNGISVEQGLADFLKDVDEAAHIEFRGIDRYLEVHVRNVDHCDGALTVQIIVRRKRLKVPGSEPLEPEPEQEQSRANQKEPEANQEFRLDFFNFPVVDNTRLQDNHRLAIVIEDFHLGENPHITLSAVIFPSEYASLRDRPGMEEARKLLESALKDEENESK